MKKKIPGWKHTLGITGLNHFSKQNRTQGIK